MQSIEKLDKLSDDLDALLKELPEKRKELHERIAEVIKTEVDLQIAESGLNDSHGHIRQWQESTVGSGGGYAAVRAVKGETGPNSPGAITNYLENGHRIRQPSGNNPNYRPRINKPYVDGYHFYQSARNTVESKVIGEVEKYVDEITQELEG